MGSTSYYLFLSHCLNSPLRLQSLFPFNRSIPPVTLLLQRSIPFFLNSFLLQVSICTSQLWIPFRYFLPMVRWPKNVLVIATIFWLSYFPPLLLCNFPLSLHSWIPQPPFAAPIWNEALLSGGLPQPVERAQGCHALSCAWGEEE